RRKLARRPPTPTDSTLGKESDSATITAKDRQSTGDALGKRDSKEALRPIAGGHRRRDRRRRSAHRLRREPVWPTSHGLPAADGRGSGKGSDCFGGGFGNWPGAQSPYWP